MVYVIKCRAGMSEAEARQKKENCIKFTLYRWYRSVKLYVIRVGKVAKADAGRHRTIGMYEQKR